MSQYLIADTYWMSPSINISGSIIATGQISSTGSGIGARNTASFFWSSRSQMESGADGRINFLNNASTGFTRFTLGLETSAFPALNVATGVILQVVAGDGTTVAGLAVGQANTTSATAPFLFIGSSAGAPTGVPANIPSGTIAVQYDTTNNKIWFYNGSWRGVVVA